ncbi:MAG TPA: hypothetical protein VKA18_10010 [Alphaproteobacteria bacterium]|nr:hypothetical protein [Alphaproteobacteria bacterium]
MLMTAAIPAATAPGVSHSAVPGAAIPCGEEAAMLAEQLAALVPEGNVRAMEALACVILRAGRSQASVSRAVTEETYVRREAGFALMAAAERIARRTLSGVMDDPSRGATRFHRLGELPDWARKSAPVTEIGPFLFYRA